MTENIILHACCATCSGYPIEILKEMGYNPIVYYFNPNIFPQEEFSKRLNELDLYTKKKNIELIIGEYSQIDWNNFIMGLENEPEKGLRCQKCFEYRLLDTIRQAKKLNVDIFTTTLTVSPHKQSNVIFEQARKLAQKYDIKFLEIDFKKNDGFFKTMQIAKSENFYRQNYCGCRYSIR